MESENPAFVLPFAVAIGDHDKLINNFIDQGQYKYAPVKSKKKNVKFWI